MASRKQPGQRIIVGEASSDVEWLRARRLPARLRRKLEPHVNYLASRIESIASSTALAPP